MERVVRSACPLNCTDGCMYEVAVRDGIAVDIRPAGDKNVLRGIICEKARRQLQRVYSPDRLLHPMVRTRSGWRRSSWEEAARMLADRIGEAVSAWGSESILLYYEWGSKGVLKGLERRFFNSLGGVTESTGSLCWAAGIAAQKYDFGANLAHDPADFSNTRLAVIWGRNPAATNLHSIPFLNEARRNGATIVLVDPAASETARLADIHIRPRPGTDGALALGMAREIIDSGFEDRAFIDRHTFGYEMFREMLDGFSVERASSICGVPEQEMRRFARQYASTKPAMILIGYGVQHYFNGGHTVRAIDALGALTGNIGIPGGGVNYGSGTASASLAPVDGSDTVRVKRGFPRPDVAARILRANGGSGETPVRVMVVSRANPVNQVGDSARTLEALSTIPFKVAVELRMSETALQCDLVLPGTSWLEESDIMTGSWHNLITYTEQAISPLGEARHEKDIFHAVATEMGIPSDLDRSLDYWADIALKPLHAHGITAATLKGRVVRIPGAPIVAWQDRKFPTPTGRYEFFSKVAEAEGNDPLPRWVEPLEAAADDPEYPFTVVNVRRMSHLHSQFASSLLRNGLAPVFMSPGAAAGAGIADGDEIDLVSRVRGTMHGVAVIRDGMRDDTLAVYDGPSVLSGAGPNLIAPAGLTDFGLGSIFCDCRVRIRKGGAA